MNQPMTPRKTSLLEDLKTPTGIFWLGSYIAFVLLGWFTPSTILQDHAWAREFADFMASIIPQIDRVTELGGAKAGEANRFVYSVLWGVMPVYAGIFFVQSIDRLKRQGIPRKFIDRFHAVGIGLLNLLIAAFGIFIWSADPSQRVVIGTLVSQFGRGLWAPLLAFAPTVFIVAAVLVFWGAATGQNLRGDRR